MQRFSGMDASFLYMETPTHHMHVCGVLVLDPSTMPDGYTFEAIKAKIRARLDAIEILRRRMLTVPLGLDHPVWIEDPDFNLDQHVHRRAIPAPGSMHELAEFVGDVAGRPLDRTLPLWQMYIVEGLEHGGVALVSKMHHATIDGITGADMIAHLLDLEPDAEDPEPPAHPWQPDPVPNELERVRDALVARLRDPLRTIRAAVRSGRSLAAMAQSVLGASDEDFRPALPFTGPRTLLNTPITANRAVAFGQADLDDLKAIKKAYGTTVNDVVLAASAMALRRFLLAHDDLPDRPLVAAVPVSVHGQSNAGGTNQVSNMFVRLPLDIDDPVEMLGSVRAETKDAKEIHNAMGVDLIQDMAQMAPPGLANLALRIYADTGMNAALPPVQNLVISNVPGPPVPLYIAGARVTGIYPFGPLIEGSGINITVLSNMGHMDFGVIACGDTVPDIWQIADGFGEAVADLRKAADSRG